jgi:hypothetical protein
MYGTIRQISDFDGDNNYNSICRFEFSTERGEFEVVEGMVLSIQEKSKFSSDLFWH